MNSYDFSRLNDKEFEDLIIDIIKADFIGIQTIERFIAGKDEGIDGRFYLGDNKVIIQSKHYLKSKYSSLLITLKKEAIKVKKINPSRYILAVSQGLTPARKDEIIKIFGSQYLRSDDILTLEDLTHKINNYAHIERKYYKLWLNSTSVLTTILHNDVIGKSLDVLEKIAINSDRYVKTGDFEIASNRLQNVNTLIITGAPGVGKTTLAEQLCIEYILDDWELVFIETDIEEAERVFDLERKQFFLYDDFLGRNYLDALTNKEDSKIVRFINRIKNKENKRLILTSRTTILNQGKKTSELFHINNTKQHEYEVEIKNASLIDKAKVLYNHIWLSELPDEFKSVFWKDRNYRKIIVHKNYNPRLISFITDLQKFTHLKPVDYWGYIIQSLNNPTEIWDHMLSKQIPKCVYYLTSLVSLNNGKINESELHDSYSQFLELISLDHSRSEYLSFKDCCEHAVKSTLQRNLEHHNEASYDVLNPSISDCLISKIKFNQDYIHNYFLALNSMSSLLHFNTLLKEVIPNRALSRVIQKFIIGLTNYKTEEYKSEFIKNLLNINRVDSNDKKIAAEIFIREVFSTKKHLIEYNYRTLLILHWITIYEIDLLSQNELKDFVGNTIIKNSDNLDHEDLNLLAQMSNVLSEGELTHRIRCLLIDYWTYSVHDFFKDDNDFNDYYDLNDADIIYARAKDYVTETLRESSIMFNEKEILDIMDNFEPTEIIERNMENYPEWNGENDYYSRHSESGYDKIDDLFDRG